ncbi:hypothetical protein Tco_0066370 [Tanacetum coccineum]
MYSTKGSNRSIIDEDEGITLVQMGVSTTSIDFTTSNVAVTTAGEEISTASPEVKTAGDSVDDIAAENLVYIRRSAAKTKDKGKGIMEESESAITKTKRQQEQERLSLETTMRLQEEFDEEERQRIAKVHEAARSFTEEEWEDIRARVEAFKELVQRLQIEEREKYIEDDQAKMLVDLINHRKRYFAAQKAEAKRNKPMTQAQQRTYMSNYNKHMGNYKLQRLKRLSFDEIKDLFETTMRRANTFVPIETEIRRGVPELVADSSQAAVTESAEAGGTKRVAEEELSQQSSKKQKPDSITRRLQSIDDIDGVDIYMLVEREYPLSRGVLTQMLVVKLLVEQNNKMSRELLRKIFMQFHRRPAVKGVGLCVADSYTGNHLEDDFTPLETIRRLLVVIRRRSHSGFKGEAFEPERRDVKVIVTKKSQTILDAPLGYVGLYTHHFSLSNLRLPIPPFICKVLNYFKVHISRFNPFGMVKLTTFAMMCKAYGGEPTVDLLRSFLNLGPAGDWLTLSNRGSADVPKALLKPITHLGNWKDSFFFIENKIIPSDNPKLLLGENKSFMLEGVDGEFTFLPAEGVSEGRNSPSAKSVNNDAPMIDATPISSVYPSNIVENVDDSDDPSYGEGEQTLVGASLPPHPEANKKLKILRKRKVASGVPGKTLPPKVQKVPTRASKVAGEAFTPLDFDSDSNIHVKELRDATDCHWVVAHVTPPSWKQHLKEIIIEQLCDIHDKA